MAVSMGRRAAARAESLVATLAVFSLCLSSACALIARFPAEPDGGPDADTAGDDAGGDADGDADAPCTPRCEGAPASECASAADSAACGVVRGCTWRALCEPRETPDVGCADVLSFHCGFCGCVLVEGLCSQPATDSRCEGLAPPWCGTCGCIGVESCRATPGCESRSEDDCASAGCRWVLCE
jgi:hypothetical protein